MDLLTVLDEAVAALGRPLEQRDIDDGWTDDLRREIQEEISVSRSALRRHGLWMAQVLRPRLDEWMAREAVRPGRLQHLVLNVQQRLTEARRAA
ncbi:hypothetical protein GCM10010145_37880 [Streptomyces ruber]|uniref:Uncharacterized protein n=2 Tax=Streptomyces TaxID=1883 RepID=A0A918BGY3_9ACTN|nr:hypothetical protein [Streptomyces ruber]GGQ64455.1 hypothetical protein GCM10010145_37880 [Streptomyces ruber]